MRGLIPALVLLSYFVTIPFSASGLAQDKRDWALRRNALIGLIVSILSVGAGGGVVNLT